MLKLEEWNLEWNLEQNVEFHTIVLESMKSCT